VRGLGAVQPLVTQYLSELRLGAGQRLAAPVPLGRAVKLLRFDLTPNPVASGDTLRFMLEFEATAAAHITDICVLIYSAQGTRVAIMDLRPCGLPLTLRPGQICL